MKEEADFQGDREYNCPCGGDVVVGDEVKFQRATFSGSHWSPCFEGYETVEGLVIKDSYGPKTQQHTFTIQRPDGSKLRIKGRNLYRSLYHPALFVLREHSRQQSER